MSCINMRPVHGFSRPKPASASQFYVSQSSLDYTSDKPINVTIETQSDDRRFRGFMIQAYEPGTGKHIGHFLPTSDSKPMTGCSAATHVNNQDKQKVVLTWIPPEDGSKDQGAKSRQVRFKATIVVTHSEFYTGFESTERTFEKFASRSRRDEVQIPIELGSDEDKPTTSSDGKEVVVIETN